MPAMNLEQWAIRHGVTHAALADLRDNVLGHTPPELIAPHLGNSEAAVQVRVRIAVSRMGWRVFRNNVGAGKLQDGSFVRWGLCNDSAQLNDKLKSSDLVGIRPVLITPMHVGRLIGQFVSLEVKEAGWHYTGTPREVAQNAWLGLITALGGHARFVTSEAGVE